MTIAENMTDVGNGRRFVQRHGHRVRYVHAWNQFLVFIDGRWCRDTTEIVRRLAKETICGMYAEAAALEDAGERRQLAAWAGKSESARRIRDMLELARSEPGVPISVEDLDRHPMLLNVINGTLDLRTGHLREPDPSDFLTKRAPVSFIPGAGCPGWLTFLDRIFAGDTVLIAFFQRVAGYVLTGLTTEQCLFLFHGRGANGKTTILEVLRALLGPDYAVAADFSLLLMRPQSGGPRNDVAELFGARLVTASEADEGSRLNETLLKAFTGGDTIRARRLYQESFEFQTTFKLLCAANDQPEIKSGGDAIWRRIRMIPFGVQIPEAEQDRQFASRLIATELPGILAWAVDGCLAWQRDGLGTPPAVRAATSAYRAESDLIARFLDECCTVIDGVAVRADALYAAYVGWSKGHGEAPMTQTMFGRKLTDHGLRREQDPSVRRVVYLGLTMRQAADDSDPLGAPTGVPNGSQVFPINCPPEARLGEGYGDRLQTHVNACSDDELERRAIESEVSAA